MKKIFICTYIFLFIGKNIEAQNVGINTSGAAPDASAMLDIVSTSKGLLVPRVALTDVTVAAPVTSPLTSLLVYNTATAGVSPNNVLPGYYYWDGAKWVAFGGSGSKSWALLGNAGTTAGTNFLGTTDATDVVFKTNSTEVFRMGNANKNVMVNATSNTTDYLSSTASNALNAVAAYVSGTNAAKGLYAYSTSSSASANAIYAEATAAGPSAIYAKLNNGTSTKAAIEADASNAPKGNAIYAYNTGDVGYSALYANTTATVNGSSVASSTSNHSIFGLINGSFDYSYGVMGRLNNAPNLSAGVIGLYSNTQYGALGYRESAALIYGVFGNAGSAGTNIAGHFKSSGGTSNIAIRMSGSTSGYLDISPAAATTSHAYVMPATQGTANTVLQNDGSGNLSWADVYGGNIQFVEGLTDITTSGGSWVDMTGMSITFTPKHSTVYVNVTASGDLNISASNRMGYVKCRVTNSTASTVYGKVVSMASDYDGGGNDNAAWNCSIVCKVTGLTVGTPTTLKVQWQNGGTNPGTARCLPATTDYSSRNMMIID